MVLQARAVQEALPAEALPTQQELRVPMAVEAMAALAVREQAPEVGPEGLPRVQEAQHSVVVAQAVETPLVAVVLPEAFSSLSQAHQCFLQHQLWRLLRLPAQRTAPAPSQTMTQQPPTPSPLPGPQWAEAELSMEWSPERAIRWCRMWLDAPQNRVQHSATKHPRA